VKQTIAAAAAMTVLALVTLGCSAGTPAGSTPAGPVARPTMAGPMTASPAAPATPAIGPTPSAGPGRPDCTSAGPLPRIVSARRRAATSWPDHVVPNQIRADLVSDQVMDSPSGAEYALISRAGTPMRGPYVLECTDLRTGAVYQGPTFPGGNLTFASGYLWVYAAPGPGSRPVVGQVSPLTLARIRSIRLPREPAGFGWPRFVAGSGHTVWIGSYRTVLRLNTVTGAPLTRLKLPPGLVALGIAMDPAHRTLYVSAAHGSRDGDTRSPVMLDYAAGSGRLLATSSGGLLRYSLGGTGLTAVPGGVWASFRIGMSGLTIHLSRDGLRMIAPPGPRIARRPANGLFHWFMFTAVADGGGALWLANQAGTIACLDPRTGQVWASEHTHATTRLIFQILAVDPKRQVIYGWSGQGLRQITPPRRCWSQNEPTSPAAGG
jgi:hypothetical protein